jgi:hypothetical protein
MCNAVDWEGVDVGIFMAMDEMFEWKVEGRR